MNGVFASAINQLYYNEEVEKTLLALYYSANGGISWEKVSEIDVSDRSYLLMFGAALGARISAAHDLSRIGLTNLFDLYVITRGEIVAPPPPSKNSSHRTKSSGKKVKRLIVETAQDNTSGPVGLSAPTLPVRNLEYGMEGEDVKALQNILISQGYSIPAGATGFFFNQTRSALSAYQLANGIVPAAGYFGPITRAQMKAANLTGLWW